MKILQKTRGRLARLLDRIVMQLRMIKAKATGKEPCTYETKHGHDFEVLKVKQVSGIPVIFYKCRKCELRATYDQFTGLCA